MNLQLRRRKKQSFGTREPAQIRSDGHLKWVRGHECACRTIGFCDERIEAAHVRTGTDGGTSLKPSDCWAIPLCQWHHRYQHQIGEAAFEREFGINMKAIAQELWLRSPHRKKYEDRHP